MPSIPIDLFIPLELIRGATPPFRLYSVKQLAEISPPAWLVDGVIPGGGLVQIFAPPRSFKTFVALDLAMHVANGRPWYGERQVQQGDVVYVIAEGTAGLLQRVNAWEEHHAVRTKNIEFVIQPVQLTVEDQITDLLGSIRFRSRPPPKLIVIDTLARCAVGVEENSAKEMGEVIAGLDRLRAETGATVMVVHHSGHNETKRARGSSALLGALDTAVKVKKDRLRCIVTCTKQKDSEEFSALRFAMKSIGESLVPVPDGLAAPVPGVKPLSERERLVCDAIEATPGLTHGELVDATAIPKSTMTKSLNELANVGLILREGRRYYPAPERTDAPHE